MNVKLSIGMPVYNGELFIERAIESILAQTFTDLPILHKKYVKVFQKRIIGFESLNRKKILAFIGIFIFFYLKLRANILHGQQLMIIWIKISWKKI